MKNVLLGISGSVAAVKAAELVSSLTEANFSVKVVVTASALHFFDETLRVPVYTDSDEFTFWKRLGDPVLHIQVHRHLDLLIFS